MVVYSTAMLVARGLKHGNTFLCMFYFAFAFFVYLVSSFRDSFSLDYITLHYITLHYITLHYITLHYIRITVMVRVSRSCLSAIKTLSTS